MKKRKTKLVLSKLPMRYFTRADLNKKTKRSLITLYLELQRVVVKLVKLKVKGVGKRLRKKKRSKKQLANDKRLGRMARARARRR
tara:strand:+ start:21 stop:275 length:255 start_codon:yes stop_codon:yes gene_type:complete